jgi:hypothetical protein
MRRGCDSTLGAEGGERLEVGCMDRVTHLRVVVGDKHGVDGKALKVACVHPCDGQIVAGYADEAHEAFVAGLDGALECASFAQRGPPKPGSSPHGRCKGTSAS